MFILISKNLIHKLKIMSWLDDLCRVNLSLRYGISNYSGERSTFQVQLGKTEVADSFEIIHTIYFIVAILYILNMESFEKG